MSTWSRKRSLVPVAAALSSSVLLPIALAAGPTLALPALSPTTACTGAAPGAVTHVVVIVMENKNSTSVIGSGDAPYLNNLANGCGQATDYHGVAHPSLPNYLAMTGGQTFGVTDDKIPRAHKIGAASMFGQLGSNWRSYQDSMATPCQKSGGGPLYAVKHNPAAYFTSLANCTTNDIPLPANPTFDAALTLVTPNLQHDMHDGTLRQGDDWIASFVPKVLASSQYQSGSLALFIVWDENDGPNHAASNLVPMIVVAPSIPNGTVCASTMDHYGLLATWQDILGLPRLANSVAARSARADFHL